MALFAAARLAAAVADLTGMGYEVKRLDLTGADEADVHLRFKQALDFPDYYGHNMNALAECLADVAAGDYGWDLNHAGLARIHRRTCGDHDGVVILWSAG